MNIVPTFWDPFTVFLERPELAIDERFDTNEKRMRNRDDLHGLIAEILAPMSKAEIEQRAHECRIPLGIVQTFDEVLTDPQLAVREVWQTIETGHVGPIRSPRPPWRIRGQTRSGLELAEPVPGDHKGRAGDHKGRAGDHKGRAGDHKGRAGDHKGRAGDHKGRAGDHKGRPYGAMSEHRGDG